MELHRICETRMQSDEYKHIRSDMSLEGTRGSKENQKYKNIIKDSEAHHPDEMKYYLPTSVLIK